MGNSIDTDGIPTIEFDDLLREYEKRGIDLHDLNADAGHFDAWRRTRGLPDRDENGDHAGSSRIYHALYRRDPAGMDACPLHADFWHWLLKASERVAWREEPGMRVKKMPLAHGIFVRPDDLTDDQLSEARRRLETASGPLDEDMWQTVRRSFMAIAPEARRCADLASEIVERHGVDTGTGYGPMVMIRMVVHC